MNVIGHEQIIIKLKALIAKNQLPHALIFTGIEAIGKKLTASYLATAMNCKLGTNNPCSTCKSCKLINSNSHPDLNYLDGKAVGVEDIRNAIANLALQPIISTYRFLIIDHADYLNSQSSNTLLKTLEEPLPNTYIILITNNPTKLLSTIRSRSQIWYFNELKDSELQAIIGQEKFKEITKNLDGQELQNLIQACAGSLGDLTDKISNLDQWTGAENFYTELKSGNLNKVLLNIKTYKDNKKMLELDLKFLKILIRKDLIENSTKPKKFELAILLEHLIEAERLIFERNLNSSYLLQNIFGNFCAGNINTTLLPQNI